jgi:glycosyltransferase involved in cell wall biosynthesis
LADAAGINQRLIRVTRLLLVSNGFNRFQLSIAAAEAYRRGLLTTLITGAYPTSKITALIARGGLSRHQKIARLLARREEVPEQMVRVLWGAEAINALAMMLRSRAPAAALKINEMAFRYYGLMAIRHVREAACRGARIYHYRAGFGCQSVREAQRLGMLALCDHSIAHPGLLQSLIDNNGQFPLPGQKLPIDPLWSAILRDIEQADMVLVNSDFVKETFRRQGYDLGRVGVINWGVDDAFLDAAPMRGGVQDISGPLRLIFAGGLNLRKGVGTLVAALKLLHDVNWKLEIAGSVDPDARSDVRPLLEDRRIVLTGWLSREALAKRMAAAEVFLFPSLAEGSARVVFEAMAAGCYIVTTPNAGSIVEDRVHGRLVRAGHPESIAGAIREISADRRYLAEIGRRNAALVRASYRQRDYGDRLATFYHELLETRKPQEAA